MDRKYGRIFTEEDLRTILRQYGTGGMDVREVLDEIKAGELDHVLKFDGDEPLFVMRAKDNAAPPTLAAYQEEAQRAGARPPMIQLVVNTHADFLKWRRENPGQCKAPD